MAKLSETFDVGRLQIAALSDGAPERALGGFFNGIEAADWTQALGITDPEQPMPFNFGTFLIRGIARGIVNTLSIAAQGHGRYLLDFDSPQDLEPIDLGGVVLPVPHAAEGRVLFADGAAAPGILVGEADGKRCLDMGFRFVAVGADVGMLVRGSEALAAKFKT